MSEEFRISPPANKNSLKKEVGKSKEPREDTQKKASKLVGKAEVNLGINDIPSVWAEKQTQLAQADQKKAETRKKLVKEKAKVEKRKKALSKKEKLHNQLAEKGATDKALLAFENAYNPKVAPKIKQILTNRKLNIREPEAWETVHELLMTPSKNKQYFCKAYVNAYKENIPLAPLAPKKGNDAKIAKVTKKRATQGRKVAKIRQDRTIAMANELEGKLRGTYPIDYNIKNKFPKIKAVKKDEIKVKTKPKTHIAKPKRNPALEKYVENLKFGYDKPKKAFLNALLTYYPKLSPQNKRDREALDKIQESYKNRTITNLKEWKDIISDTLA